MQPDPSRSRKTFLINQILPLANEHLLQSHSSRMVYDRCSLAEMSFRDLSEILTFLEGLTSTNSDENSLSVLSEALMKVDESDLESYVTEHITLTDVEPSDLMDGRLYSK